MKRIMLAVLAITLAACTPVTAPSALPIHTLWEFAYVVRNDSTELVLASTGPNSNRTASAITYDYTITLRTMSAALQEQTRMLRVGAYVTIWYDRSSITAITK